MTVEEWKPIVFKMLVEEMIRLQKEREEVIKIICNAKKNTFEKRPDFPQEYTSEEGWI